MKTIKAVTDFGIVDVKTIGTKREIFGQYWIVCEVPTSYMNSTVPLMMRRVLHFETGRNLPLSGMPHNATAKDFLYSAEHFLSNIPVDAQKLELTKYQIINN